MKVSPLALGTASFGDGARASWHIGTDAARALVRAALDRGLSFFDTASAYAGGVAETRLGSILAELGVRRDVVLATKIFFPTGPGPNQRGLSRRHIVDAFDLSLERLRTDRVDLLYLHRWDRETPIDETLAALDQLVRSGRVLYLGASSMSAWRLMKALGLQRSAGNSPFVAMQGHYNLLYREEEREMLPLCREEGLAYLAWSPLARGLLAGDAADPRRTAGDEHLGAWRTTLDNPGILQALHRVAAEREQAPATVALAWLRAKSAIPVIGAASAGEIDVALASLDQPVDAEAIAALEEAYVPRPIIGFDPAEEAEPAAGASIGGRA